MSIGVFFQPLGPFCPHRACPFVYWGLSRVGGSSSGLLMVKDEACGQLTGGCAHTDLSSSLASLWSVLELDSTDRSHKLYPALWEPMDCSPPGSPVHGILQARRLERVVMPSSRGIFPTQGWNQELLHCRRILYRPNHQEALTMVEMLNLEPPWLWLTRRVLLLSSSAAPAGRASGLPQAHCVWPSAPGFLPGLVSPPLVPGLGSDVPWG